MITFEIDIGQGPRTISFDPEQITLGFLEDMEQAQETGKWRDLRPVIAELLGLTAAESRAITVRQFKGIAEAMRQATAEPIPNA